MKLRSLIKSYFLALVLISSLTNCKKPISSTDPKYIYGDSLFFANVPPQPGQDTWKFVEELKSPMWSYHNWQKKNPLPHQADLSGGINIIKNFPDPKNGLFTAYDDLLQFLQAGNILENKNGFPIETIIDQNLVGESFRVDVNKDNCKIFAGAVDGIRRAIFFIEDEMLRNRGPLLDTGIIEKHPVIERRISRCFFGPIKRFPAMRDELMDDVDYYPDQYLNRLAHEGVNGLWLTIEFRDLVTTDFTPDAAIDGEKRLTKLRKTVEKCLKYGIKTYIFCIEPRAWDSDHPVLTKHPELAGSLRGRQHFFCPMSENAQKYLYQSVNKIFSAVPDLGGIINITHGERGTTCLSSVSSISDYHGLINCPRCSNKEPWEILHASLSAMERGMHDAAPDAVFISWLYMPQPQRYVTGDSYSLADWVYDLPAHTPDRVILQFNFESGVTRQEFGKLLVGGDYWISNPGPSERFRRIAEIAGEHDTPVSAKIQTGSSHEVATVPYVTVPSLLYKKFKAMHDLGVSSTMLCWYFGNYPGLMNKSAGELSMKPFPENEQDFLTNLASIYWRKEDVPKVVAAWEHFRDGYENYPLTNMFQYYGPMHDGPVWPLFLEPVDAPLSPTWQIGSSTTLKPWPPSGDRIGECIGEILTLEEVVELAKRITTSWDKGMSILSGLEKKYKDEPERLAEIGVAEALGIQLKSGYNILNFYNIREKMLRSKDKKRLEMLNSLKKIINEEILLNERLLVLCSNDSRLGFHSEAEGYKYFPEKIQWRMDQLKHVLNYDIPRFKNIIRKNELLYPEYTGMDPQGKTAFASWKDDSFDSDGKINLPSSLKWLEFDYGEGKNDLKWAALNDKQTLFIVIEESSGNEINTSTITNVYMKIEPRRLWPVRNYNYPISDTSGNKDYQIINQNGKNYLLIQIPFDKIINEDELFNPLRLSIRVQRRGGAYAVTNLNNPLTSRLLLGADNSADLMWLIPADN